MSVENLPTYDQLLVKLSQLARDRCEWAGIPIPQIEQYRLQLEPRFPYQFNACSNEDVDADLEHTPMVDVINQWWSDVKHCEVAIYETPDGKRHWTLLPFSKSAMLMGTMLVSVAWPFDAELKALQKLHELVELHKLHSYLITGMFIETSQRSGVTYMFRRLRPTLAIKAGLDGQLKILCALCRHSIGWYRGTWGGAMCPTDDVIANLCWMRGDEAKFWAQSNQHHPITPQAGL
jgi:hypothetical protein